MPKLATWASPHSCARIVVRAPADRSAAITAAEPRRNANGEAPIRS